MALIKLALVGFGKIARDQHLPALLADDAFELTAIVDPHQTYPNVAHFSSIDALFNAMPTIEAVVICTPPQIRSALARQALMHQCHVFLEKPPAATLADARVLVELAAKHQRSLFASWHSRAADAVEPARAWLAGRDIRRVNVAWKEDVRVWHPGQQWIREAGGMGVFDPGINALSILTALLPPLTLQRCDLFVPSNWRMPAAANLDLRCANGIQVLAEFDFRQTGPQLWNIDIETDAGVLKLSHGGAVMHVNDQLTLGGTNPEYPRLYAQFAKLIREQTSDVDLAPLELVTEALAQGEQHAVDAFD